MQIGLKPQSLSGIQMADQGPPKYLDETSPSVQSHLGIIQGVIERMAANSTSAKSWCIALVSAILVVVADKSKATYGLLALIPILFFVMLDAYYLAMEKGFREAYNQFVSKLHGGQLTGSDLFSVIPAGNKSSLQWDALKSFSIWGFYGLTLPHETLPVVVG